MSDCYAALDAIARDTFLPVATVCEVLGVSRSAYYDWLNRVPGAREHELQDLTPTIVEIFLHHRRRYGARRIADELKDRNILCSAKRVAQVLRNQGVRAIQPKSFVPKTTDSRHGLGFSPNLLIEADEPTAVRQVWVGNITYLSLQGGGFAYLAALMDRYSRDILAWAIEDTMGEPLVRGVLRHAIREHQPKAGVIHHTDRGGQYAGTRYRAVLKRAGMNPSMSRPDNCSDNAFMESCWGALQRELAMTEYESTAAARTIVAEYVRYYRFERKHLSIGYLTPHQFATRNRTRK